MRNYWLSWYADIGTEYTLHWPWWISGCRLLGDDEMTEQNTICAAVQAPNEDAAKALIVAAHDKPVTLEWRFCTEQSVGWSPFNGRFPQGKWMKWPLPAPPEDR